MLILSRQIGEVLVVGDNVRITLLDRQGDKIKLGIDAPKHVLVDRLEVSEAREQETANEHQPSR